MQVQTCEKDSDLDSERLILEHLYKSLDQRLGYPAQDKEICDEMKISLDEFHHILNRIKGLNLGSFKKVALKNGDGNNEPLIMYVPDPSKEDSSCVLRESEIREMLTTAIESLPKMERLVTSLHYYDELTLKEIEAVLGIHESEIAQLHTKAMLRLRSKLNPSE